MQSAQRIDQWLRLQVCVTPPQYTNIINLMHDSSSYCVLHTLAHIYARLIRLCIKVSSNMAYIIQAFFLTPLGRSGEGQSSETLSFFLEFYFFSWVLSFLLSFLAFSSFFSNILKKISKGFLISTFWKNLAIKMA